MGVRLRERFPGQWRIYVNHRNQRTARPVGEYETAVEAKRIVEEQQLALGFFQFPTRRDPRPKEPPALTVGAYYATFVRVYVDSACRESTRERYAGTLVLHVLCP